MTELIEQKILDDIVKERRRQDRKWGVQTHAPATWLIILIEEVGEAARALLTGGLSVRVIAASLTTIQLTGRQVGHRMRSLAQRTLVVHVPSPAGAYWCLTPEGKQVAKFVLSQ